MIEFTVLPYGDCAVLLELADPTEVLALRDGLLARREPAIRAVVPAARTVLVEFDPSRTDPERIAAIGIEMPDQTSDRLAGDPVCLPVRYAGADLAAVAEHCQLSVPELVELHAAAEYTVQFCGFSPGFGYLTGLDDRLRLPRLTTPRTEVPAGSVAIADEYTGVYPRSSPGGWRLLGRTSAVLFDLDRHPPAVLSPGTRVRFVPQ